MNGFVSKADKWIDLYCEVFPFSGSIRITHRGNTVYRRNIGLSDIENGVYISDETRFRLYSMTKPFCAIAVMTLCEKGKLSLDDHPGKYLPYAKKLHPAISLRNLMGHTSGLPDFSQAKRFELEQYRQPLSGEDMIQMIAELPMNFEPGTDFRYTNTAFVLPSLVIEAVSGMSFSEYMEKNVFSPLGMENSGIDSFYRIVPHRARGYDADGEKIVPAPPLVIDWLRGAGAGFSTADDVYRLNIAVKNKLLLGEESWKTLLDPGKWGFGLGCSVINWHGKQRITHNGGHSGFRTLHIQLPEDDFDIIMLSNMGFGNARNIFAEAFYSLYYNEAAEVGPQPELDAGFAYNGSATYPLLSPSKPPYFKQPLDEYYGKYEGGGEALTVTEDSAHPENEGLEILRADGRYISVYPYAPFRFQNRLTDETCVFTKNDDGSLSLDGMKKIPVKP